MREILFRGKAIDDNWYYGVPLVFTEDYVCMTAPHTHNKAVLPETVGQYTGLTDKNGKKIFEGDIVRYPDSTMFPSSEETINEGFVDWDENTMCFYFTNRFAADMEDFYVDNGRMVEVEVIGNIHDNPELMEVGQG